MRRDHRRRAGDDNIDARGGNDIIIGGAGDDHIIAGSGNDIVYAGAGNDMVFAGSGNDIVFGGSGNDRLYGEDGDDTILGEEGDDFISGGSGADILLGGAGNDTLQGDAGNDTLDGGDGDDNLAGGADNDVMMGGAGNDSLSGGDGNDVLSDGAGWDTVHGGAGDDHVMAAADAADDVYDGGAGQDTLDYSTATFSVTVDLGSGTADGLDIGHDLIAAFEEVITGSGDDHIVAGSSSVSMTGGDGNDTFEFQRAEERSAGDDGPQDHRLHGRRPDRGCDLRDHATSRKMAPKTSSPTCSTTSICRQTATIARCASDSRNIDSNQLTFVDVHDRPDTDDFYTIEVVGHHQLQFTVAVA